ncbi:MAG: hypothetical protein BWY38_00664 [Ignavibacteria bacterium ADurb.Bin266]|jgi:hypothetical protein|nr:MAG: hypothetical protein BWY38_00664 [Ignavibacteria bacterium ADurb.Bin266]
MIRDIIFFILIFLFLSCSQKQLVTFNSEELTGIKIQSDRIILKVIDHDTAEPLIGANINFTNSDIEIAPTNINGLTFIPTGFIGNIKVSYMGYKSTSFEIKSNSLNNILVRMVKEEFIVTEYVFIRDKNDAKKDLSSGIIQIYENIYDSTQVIKENLAKKFGFKYNYPSESIMILNVDEYNQEVIKFLEKRNGSNWYERFKSELDSRINEKFKK